MLVEFDFDEVGYHVWQDRNPAGWVLNAPESGHGDVMLHKPGCMHIRWYPPSESRPEGWRYTMGDRVKICSDDKNEIMVKARIIGGMSRCLTCKP